MSQIITTADGTEHEFPDGTPEAVMRKAVPEYGTLSSGPSLGPPLAQAGAAVAAGAGAIGAGRMAGAIPTALRAAGRMIPGVREAMHLGDAMQELRGGTPRQPAMPAAGPAPPPVPASPQAPTTAPEAISKPSTSLATVTAADKARFPEALGGYDEGEPITRAELQRIKRPAGTVAARAAKNPRAPGSTIQNDKIVPAPPPGKTEAGNPQRGAGPSKLAKRAAQMRGEPVPGTVAARAAKPATRVGNVIEGPSWAGNPEGAAAARAEGLAKLRQDMAAAKGGTKKALERLGKLAAEAADTPLGKAAGKVVKLASEADKALSTVGITLPAEVWQKIIDDFDSQITGHRRGQSRGA